MQVSILFVFALVGCELTATAEHRREREAWHGPCADSATLLATTGGSPNTAACPNKRHRMRSAVATAQGEEIGALVVCECVSH